MFLKCYTHHSKSYIFCKEALINIQDDEKIYIAIDIALNTSGVAVVDSGGQVLETRLIKVTTGWEYYRKLSHLYTTYYSLFEELLTYGNLSLILEGRLKAGWGGNTLASIEAARITAYLAYTHVCNKHNLVSEVNVYDPNVVKHFITGNRTSKKDEMYEKSISRFSYLKDVEFQEDKFDAIYLSLYHLHGKGKDEHTKRDKKKRKV